MADSPPLLRVRPSGEATFVLHWRDPGKVATAGGLYDTIPAGEFQPSTVMGDPAGADFDLWRNIVRELNEELLGAPEYDGSTGRPLDYERWPLYRAPHRARATGRVRPYCFGVGCGALTLATTIPSALVIDDEVFEELFGEVVRTNAEGVAVTNWNGQDTTRGVPFTQRNASRFIKSGPMAPPARHAWLSPGSTAIFCSARRRPQENAPLQAKKERRVQRTRGR